MEEETDIVPAIVRLNESIVLIRIMANDAIYSSPLSLWLSC